MEEAGKMQILSQPGTNIYLEMEKVFKDPLNQLGTSVNDLVSTAGTVLGGDFFEKAKEGMMSATLETGNDIEEAIKRGFDGVIDKIESVGIEEYKFEDLTGKIDEWINVVKQYPVGGVGGPDGKPIGGTTNNIDAPININVGSTSGGNLTPQDAEIAQKIAQEVQTAINGLMNRNYGGVSK